MHCSPISILFCSAARWRLGARTCVTRSCVLSRGIVCLFQSDHRHFSFARHNRVRFASGQQRCARGQTCEADAEVTAGLFQVSDTAANRGDKSNAHQILGRGAAHLDEELSRQPLRRARLLATTGEAYSALGDIARAAKTLDHILAAVQPEVGNFRSLGLQHRLPHAFTAADIEHVADGSAQIIFGRTDRQTRLAHDRLARTDAEIFLAIPAVEIGAVVDFWHE